MFEYKPVGARVVLKLKKKDSTVIMPDSLKDQGWDLEAEVVDVGSGVPIDVKVGLKVLLTPIMMAGNTVYDRTPDFYTIINANQIFAIRRKEDDKEGKKGT